MLFLRFLFLLIILPVFLVNKLNSAYHVLGNNVPNAKNSFTFPLSVHAFYRPQGIFFVGAERAVEKNQFALAFAFRATKAFTPLAPEKIMLNGVPNQVNPLNGAAVTYLSLTNNDPLAVSQAQPDIVNFIFDYGSDPKNIKMQTSVPIHDALAQKSVIVGLTGTPAEDTLPLFFAAVKPVQSPFGTPGSGIAYGVLNKITVDNKNSFVLEMVDAITGNLSGNKAAPLDIASQAIAITHSAQEFTRDTASIFWSNPLQRLYIGLGVRAGTDDSDGVRALVLGTLTTKPAGKNIPKTMTLALTPIAPDSAIGNDSIIGARGSGITVTINSAHSMKTSTLLSYIIVNGGVGDPDDMAKKVFALPLVSSTSQPGGLIGVIAKKDQMPVDFPASETAILLERNFTIPATVPADMPAPTDAAALVGGGDLPSAATQIFVHADAVFASVQNGGNNVQPGIFHSQAVFDVWGRIQGWTAWQRAAGFAQGTAGLALDSVTGSFWYLPITNGVTDTVLHTTWSADKTNSQLASALTLRFKDVPGGVQGLTNYAPTTPGFSQSVGKRLSVIVATGYHCVTLIQTGSDTDGGNFGPLNSFGEGLISQNGSLNGFKNGLSYISVSGGALTEIGQIVASTFVDDGTQCWLVVSGSRGIAILAYEDGTGFSTADGAGLESGFVGLDASMRFITFGDYTRVSKLQSLDGKLFIGTAKLLDMVTLTAQSVAARGKNSSSIHLAQADVSSPRFQVLSDMHIADGIILIATNTGLFYTLNQESMPEWIPVAAPYPVGGPTQIIPIVPSAPYQNFVNSGNLFLGDPSIANDQERIYRHVILLHKGSTRVIPFPDFITKKTGRLYLMDLQVARDYISTDGAVFYFTGASFDQKKLFVEVLGDGVQSGNILAARNANPILLFDQATTLGPIMRDYASGAWLVWGSFGVQVDA